MDSKSWVSGLGCVYPQQIHFWSYVMANEDMSNEASPAPSRGRKRIDSINTPPNLVSRLHHFEERQYEAALESADLKTALFEYEGVQARRDSVSRKLCGGSTAVTVDDLARCEAALSSAKEVLSLLAYRQPILKRHPVIAVVVADS